MILHAVRAQKLQTFQLTTKGTAQMVVLAMHIIGNGAAKRHKTGARRDRQKITVGCNKTDDLA